MGFIDFRSEATQKNNPNSAKQSFRAFASGTPNSLWYTKRRVKFGVKRPDTDGGPPPVKWPGRGLRVVNLPCTSCTASKEMVRVDIEDNVSPSHSG
jgi:hypothetical protein